MSFLYPSLITGDETHEEGMESAPGSPEERVIDETLQDRREKFLTIINTALDVGLTEKGLAQFLTEGRLRALGGLTIIDYLEEHEEGDAHLPILEELQRRV